VKSKLNLFTSFHFYRCFIALFSIFSISTLLPCTLLDLCSSLYLVKNKIRKFFTLDFLAFKNNFLNAFENFSKIVFFIKYFLSSRMLSDFSLRGDWMSTLTHNKVLYNSKSLAEKKILFLFSVLYSHSNAKKNKWKHSHLALCWENEQP
jgi:hypothetical protein